MDSPNRGLADEEKTRKRNKGDSLSSVPMKTIEAERGFSNGMQEGTECGVSRSCPTGHSCSYALVKEL